jgi:hypothetical protein
VPYHRRDAPKTIYTGEALTARLLGIGIRFSTEAIRDPNIEDVLISAAHGAVMDGEGRLWTTLLDWWSVHHPCVNADRLVRALKELDLKPLQAFFAGLAQSMEPQGRFHALASIYRGPRLVIFNEEYRYRLARDGEAERFQGTALAVPSSLYQESTRDVFSQKELCAWHANYRWRVMIGPTFRADLWVACERGFSRTAYALAQETYCSLGAARRVLQDYELVRGSRVA